MQGGEAIQEEALEFAKKNKKPIAKRLTDKKIYPPDKHPVSVFMAGSPGAGKTEASKELLETLTGDDCRSILRIDPDELREELPGYNGRNSNLFQGATSILVEKMHDYALQNSQSFILDGTLARYEVAERNVERSLAKGRPVQILYVYQKPELAWDFVQARAKLDGRHVPPDQFVEQYFGARETVNRLKLKFRASVKVDLLLKNTDGSNRSSKVGVDQIDYHIPENYDRDQVLALVGLGLQS
jgi:UDP-N-acetylglucosamine kinase